MGGNGRALLPCVSGGVVGHEAAAVTLVVAAAGGVGVMRVSGLQGEPQRRIAVGEVVDGRHPPRCVRQEPETVSEPQSRSRSAPSPFLRHALIITAASSRMI